MTIYQSDWAKGSKAGAYPHFAGEVVAQRATFTFLTAQNIVNDIIEMLELPQGCTVVDAILDIDDLDSGTAMVLDIGTMSGTFGDAKSARTCSDELFDGITTAQTGGVVRPTLAKAYRIAPSAASRGIGVKIMTAAGTPVTGTIGLTVFYTSP